MNQTNSPRMVAQMSEPIVCPNCKILNPPQAQVCDCGHIIGMVRTSESAEVHNLASANRAKWKGQVAAATVGAGFVAYLLVKFVVRLLNQMNGQSKIRNLKMEFGHIAITLALLLNIGRLNRNSKLRNSYSKY